MKYFIAKCACNSKEIKIMFWKSILKKYDNNIDPITGDAIKEENKIRIFLYVNSKDKIVGSDVACKQKKLKFIFNYDIHSLLEWLYTDKNFINPQTGLQFNDKNIEKIYRCAIDKNIWNNDYDYLICNKIFYPIKKYCNTQEIEIFKLLECGNNIKLIEKLNEKYFYDTHENENTNTFTNFVNTQFETSEINGQYHINTRGNILKNGDTISLFEYAIGLGNYVIVEFIVKHYSFNEYFHQYICLNYTVHTSHYLYTIDQIMIQNENFQKYISHLFSDTNELIQFSETKIKQHIVALRENIQENVT